jgi:hypothetical protein
MWRAEAAMPLRGSNDAHHGDHDLGRTWNEDPKPFIWKATADDIIAKVQRGRATLHQIKTKTDH